MGLVYIPVDQTLRLPLQSHSIHPFRWLQLEIYSNIFFYYTCNTFNRGVVNVFDLVSSTQASISYSLSITKPGTKSAPIKLSAVTSLSWSSDGYALAVGWAYGGLSVWSVYGCLLTSTVSEDTFVHAS